MRYAIFSDIHANLRSWQSILDDMSDAGAESLICLGDIVGYGPMPQVVLDEVRSRSSAIVLGNHDAAACGRIDSSLFNPKARAVIDWTRRRIDRDGIDFLKQLPLSFEENDLLFVHAETIRPARFSYIVDTPRAAENLASCFHRAIFIGHTHHQALFVQEGETVEECVPDDFVMTEDCRYLVNVGTAGEPRNPGDLRARYVLFDSNTGSVQFRAVTFDTNAYREDLAREKLPVTPFFIRALDFARGKYEPGTLRKEQGLERLPEIPEDDELAGNRP